MKAFDIKFLEEFETVVKAIGRFMTKSDLDVLGKCRIAQFLNDEDLLKAANDIINHEKDKELLMAEIRGGK